MFLNNFCSYWCHESDSLLIYDWLPLAGNETRGCYINQLKSWKDAHWFHHWLPLLAFFKKKDWLLIFKILMQFRWIFLSPLQKLIFNFL